jgi:hypothetical protein
MFPVWVPTDLSAIVALGAEETPAFGKAAPHRGQNCALPLVKAMEQFGHSITS